MLIHILIFRCSSRPLIKERLTTDTNKDQDREKFKELERNNYNFFHVNLLIHHIIDLYVTIKFLMFL